MDIHERIMNRTATQEEVRAYLAGRTGRCSGTRRQKKRGRCVRRDDIDRNGNVREAMKALSQIEADCKAAGVTLVRRGRHWMFNRGKVRLLDYWPSTGKAWRKCEEGAHYAGAPCRIVRDEVCRGETHAWSPLPDKAVEDPTSIDKLDLAPGIIKRLRAEGFPTCESLLASRATGRLRAALKSLRFGAAPIDQILQALESWEKKGK